MSEVLGTRGLGFGLDNRTGQPHGERVIGRDPGGLLGVNGRFEAGDITCYNYSSASPDVDGVEADFYDDSGIMSNVEIPPLAPPTEVERGFRYAAVLPGKGGTNQLSTQAVEVPHGGGTPGREMRTASSGLCIVKVLIPAGITVRPGTALVPSPGQRYLEVAGNTERKMIARLTYVVGPNDPFGNPYVAGDVAYAMVEFFGEAGLGFDVNLAD